MTVAADDFLDPQATALVDAGQAPDFLTSLMRASLTPSGLPGLLRRAALQSQQQRRHSAVLMLLADGPEGPDLLLTQRADSMRTHAGQPAFPGGALDDGEDPVAAALREGAEETGLDPASVTPLVLMPRLYLPASEFVVHPVLAYWHDPGQVWPVNPAETAAVERVSVRDLANPANRVWVRYRDYRGAGFQVAGMLVWGFTGALVEALLELGGWAQPWQQPDTRTVDLSPR